MSQENVEIVRRIWRIWSDGVEREDPRALSAVYEEGLIAPEAMFTPTQELPGASGRTYVGADGMRDFVRAWVEDWRDWRMVLEDAVDAGDDHVVAVIHQSAIGRSSDAPVSLRFAAVFTFRDGRVVDRRDYHDLPEALKAVGLEE